MVSQSIKAKRRATAAVLALTSLVFPNSVSADWAACRKAPTRACLIEEAVSSVPLNEPSIPPSVAREYARLYALAISNLLDDPVDIATVRLLPKSSLMGDVLNPKPFGGALVRAWIRQRDVDSIREYIKDVDGSTRRGFHRDAVEEAVRKGDLASAKVMFGIFGIRKEDEGTNFPSFAILNALLTFKRSADAEQWLKNEIIDTGLRGVHLRLGHAYAAIGDKPNAARMYKIAAERLAALVGAAPPPGNPLHNLETQYLVALHSVDSAAFEKRFEAVRATLEMPGERAALRALVEDLASSGHLDRALAIARSLDDSFAMRSLPVVARAFAKNGRYSEARELVGIAAIDSATIERDIAEAQALAGDVNGSLETVSAMPAGIPRNRALLAIAKVVSR